MSSHIAVHIEIPSVRCDLCGMTHIAPELKLWEPEKVGMQFAAKILPLEQWHGMSPVIQMLSATVEAAIVSAHAAGWITADVPAPLGPTGTGARVQVCPTCIVRAKAIHEAANNLPSTTERSIVH